MDAEVAAWMQALLAEDGPAKRRALAKSITLLESTRSADRLRADLLLTALLPHTGGSVRLGISGVPGVGKSSFIEVLGLQLTAAGQRVAVLAVDPSSSVSGGSILGDKTRMERLSVDPQAFIRPSPTAGNLGGVTEKTREALLLCEAAGFDVVLVETVGVGQSEAAVAGMTDLFVLLQLPNAGDDLQAIKKGVMELADMVLINKADLDPAAALRAQAQITSAMRMLGQHRATAMQASQVMLVSAATGQGLAEFRQQVQLLIEGKRSSGALATRRQQQAQAWMWERIAAGLQLRFRQDPLVRQTLAQTTDQVLSGQVAASVAARQLLALLDEPIGPQ